MLDVPAILPTTRGVPYRLFRYYGSRPRGQSVLKVSGVYTITDTPDNNVLVTLRDGVDYFLGGHVYLVSTAVANALIADGFTVEYVAWEDLTATWGLYASDLWGEIG